METVRIYPLSKLSRTLRERLHAGQREAAQVWNLCCALHQEARQAGTVWPRRNELQKATKGLFALHSQSIQMICHAFLANVETTRQLKKQNRQIRYPYKLKHFYPLLWPAQAIQVNPGRVILPMGRGRRSLVLRVEVPANAGACKIVWNDGYELHVTIPAPVAEEPPGDGQATVDLGQIHQAAVTTNTGSALVVSGRGIRSLKRRLNKALGQIARKRSRCRKGSRRWRKLQAARAKVSTRFERQVRDLNHKGTRQVVDFCKVQHVGTLYIGTPHGVRKRPSGRHHRQRMAQWEYGRDIRYLQHKCEQSRIVCFTGTERGTSSRCPECGHRQRPPQGRTWVCKRCAFRGHRDVVGSTNMHALAFGEPIAFPQRITYRPAGPVQGSGSGVNNRSRSPEPARRSRPDTGRREGSARLHLRCSGESVAQPPAAQAQQGSAKNRPYDGSLLEAHSL